MVGPDGLQVLEEAVGTMLCLGDVLPAKSANSYISEQLLEADSCQK